MPTVLRRPCCNGCGLTAYGSDDTQGGIIMSEQHGTTTMESTPASRYQAVKLAHDLNTGRLRELESKATTYILTEEEAGEMGRLERMLANQAQVLERLEGEMVFAQQRLDVSAVVETWSGLVTAKLEAYQDFAAALAQLEEAFDGILRAHAAQEAEVMRLPVKVQERLVFP